MLKNVLDTDLSDKVAVVTGAGGVLCSDMAKVLARAGAKVALLNRTVSKAQVYADEMAAPPKPTPATWWTPPAVRLRPPPSWPTSAPATSW